MPTSGGSVEEPNNQIETDQEILEALVAEAFSGEQVDLNTLAQSAETEGFTVTTGNTQYTKNGITYTVNPTTGVVDENPVKAYGLTSENVLYDEVYNYNTEQIIFYSNGM